MAGKNQKKKDDLNDEYEEIQKLNKSLDVKKYYVDPDEDLPEFGELELYDYDTDLKNVKEESTEIIDDLVDLYLGDVDEIKNHKYIQRKKKEDARIYASSFFLERMSEKALLQLLRQIDNGENSPRMYEVLNQTMKEIRENNKDGRNARTEVEKLYKEMRKDLGLNEHVNNGNVSTNESDEDEGEIIDTLKLNEKIDDYVKNNRKDS